MATDKLLITCDVAILFRNLAVSGDNAERRKMLARCKRREVLPYCSLVLHAAVRAGCEVMDVF